MTVEGWCKKVKLMLKFGMVGKRFSGTRSIVCLSASTDESGLVSLTIH